MRLVVFFLLASFCTHAQDPYKNIYSRHAWEARDQWQKADELIRLMQIPRDGHVADIGCHEGYMTFKLSKVVGAGGMVYAVDVDESKLEKVRNSATRGRIRNITAIKGDFDDPRLPATTLDAVIILDTYHEMDDHDDILRHLLQALKTGGRLVICEPIADARRKLTREEQERRHELGMPFALGDLKRAGFEIAYQQDPFADRSEQKGDRMWVLVAVKK